jgi:hypothetical protein
VAIFEPVILDGTEVTRASLHNVSILEELELGIDDVVTVYKANMIIPQIEENLTRSNTLETPAHCPSCGYKTEIKQLNDSKVLQCFNILCPAQMLGRFSHFVSRNAMNIEGLSEATLEKLIEKGFIKTFDDIYKLEQYKSEIVKMDGFGLKFYNKLIDAIGKSKDVKMENKFYLMGIEFNNIWKLPDFYAGEDHGLLLGARNEISEAKVFDYETALTTKKYLQETYDDYTWYMVMLNGVNCCAKNNIPQDCDQFLALGNCEKCKYIIHK